MPGTIHSNLNSSTAKQTFWKGHICRQAESGLTIKEYCRRNGLSLHTFRYWKRRIVGSVEEGVKVSAVEVGRFHCGDVFDLRVRTLNGHVIEVRGEFSSSDVARLVKELE